MRNLLHRLVDCLQHQFFHDVIRIGVWVATVGAEFLREGSLLVGEGGVVVDIHDVVGFGVGSQFLIDVDDGLGGILDVGIPHKPRARRN